MLCFSAQRSICRLFSYTYLYFYGLLTDRPNIGEEAFFTWSNSWKCCENHVTSYLNWLSSIWTCNFSSLGRSVWFSLLRAAAGSMGTISWAVTFFRQLDEISSATSSSSTSWRKKRGGSASIVMNIRGRKLFFWTFRTGLSLCVGPI